MTRKILNFEVTCPCCKATLTIDSEVRAVIAHEPPPKQALLTDLGEAARALREKEGRRETQFQKSVEAQRDRAKLLEKKFEQAFEKVKDQPIGPPPTRDIDLD